MPSICPLFACRGPLNIIGQYADNPLPPAPPALSSQTLSPPPGHPGTGCTTLDPNNISPYLDTTHNLHFDPSDFSTSYDFNFATLRSFKCSACSPPCPCAGSPIDPDCVPTSASHRLVPAAPPGEESITLLKKREKQLAHGPPSVMAVRKI